MDIKDIKDIKDIIDIIENREKDRKYKECKKYKECRECKKKISREDIIYFGIDRLFCSEDCRNYFMNTIKEQIKE